MSLFDACDEFGEADSDGVDTPEESAADDIINETNLTDDQKFLRVVESALVPPLYPEPTRAQPGTREKVEIMRIRYAAGCAIFHPGDNRNVIAKKPTDFLANNRIASCAFTAEGA